MRRSIPKEIKIILFTLLVFIVFLLIIGVAKKVLQSSRNGLIMDFLIEIITKTGLIIFLILVMKFNGLYEINGWKRNIKIKNTQAFGMVTMIIGIMIFNNRSIYMSVPFNILILFIASNLLTGSSEEIVMRGIIQPLVIKAQAHSKAAIIKGVLMTSILFSLIHFFNLIKDPGNWVGILYQVFFAMCIGIFFGGLLIRTGNLIPVCIIHGLINFAFGISKLKIYLNVENIPAEQDNFKILSLVVTSIVFLLIGFSGLFMIKMTDEQEYIERIRRIKSLN
ncbi:MAG: CPBP family intramembrane metalloprotease [Bacteroidales bacterium]|nr:CPBP family intramembrane metalloprotease [Bacteroidales bacterium]